MIKLRRRNTETFRRPSRWRIMSTQFRLEASTRGQLLKGYMTVALVLLAIVWLIAPFKTPDVLALDLDLYANGIFGAMGFAVMTMMAGFWAHTPVNTVYAMWNRHPLPVRTLYLYLPTLAFRLLEACLLALVWGCARLAIDVSDPFLFPFSALVPLAVHIQALCWWNEARGSWRGSLIGAIGLIPMILLCFDAMNPYDSDRVYAFSLMAVALGIPLSYEALRSLRGETPWDMTNLSNLPPGDLEVPADDTESASPDTTSAPRWSVISQIRFPAFSSALWAQVWFEWRRCTMWLAIVLCVEYLILPTAIHEIRVYPFFATTGFVAAPVLFAYLYNSPGTTYKKFVSVRPQSSQRLGRAKMVAMALALSVVALVTYAIRLAEEIFGGQFSGFSGVVEHGVMMIYTAVFSVYGLLGFGVSAVCSSLPMLPGGILSELGWGGYDNPEHLPMQNIPSIDSIPWARAFILAGHLGCLLLYLIYRYRAHIPKPRRRWFRIAALAITLGVSPLLTGEAPWALVAFCYMWLIPWLLLALTLGFGLKARLISRMDGLAGAALFLLLYLVTIYTYARQPGVWEAHLTPGVTYWYVALASAVVWYPSFASRDLEERAEVDDD